MQLYWKGLPKNLCLSALVAKNFIHQTSFKMDQDFLHVKKELAVNGKNLSYYSLRGLEEKGHQVRHLPFSIRILLENALRNYDGYIITAEHVETLLHWTPQPADKEIPF